MRKTSKSKVMKPEQSKTTPERIIKPNRRAIGKHLKALKTILVKKQN